MLWFDIDVQAGPFTKYARRYRLADDFLAQCNSKEAGQLLADVVLETIDPLAVIAFDQS